MKARTLVELLTLSSNLYLISKDRELFERLEKMVEKGMKKAGDLAGENSEDEQGALLRRIVDKAKQAKEELEEKILEIAANVYRKVHIAHTDDLGKLMEQVEELKNSLALAEARLVNLENKGKN